MYNDPYYSRRGRTIERKKTASGHVIQPELVPVYYNYLKDNGLLPTPPEPVEDGSYVMYQVDKEYSFPSSATSLFSALGTMLDAFEIPVDITAVDCIRLEYTLTPSSFSLDYRAFNGFSATKTADDNLNYDTIPVGVMAPWKYILFFYRSSVDTFVLSVNNSNNNYIIPPKFPCIYVKKVDTTGSTMVVKSITVSTYAS